MDIAAMTDTLDRFMPHGQCFLWIKPLVVMHALSDSVIFIAYFTIPVALGYLVYKRGDLQFSKLHLMFAAFILLCGTTHLLEVWNIWNTAFWLSGGFKALTAVVSACTAIALWYYMPTLLTLPSPAQQRLAHEELDKSLRQRQLALHALRESDERFRHAFDYAPIGMALMAMEGRWLKVNRQLCRILGIPPETMQNDYIQSMIHPDDVPRLMAALTKLRRDARRGFQMELRYTGKQEGLLWLSLNASLVCDAAETPLYFIVQIVDVTERIEAERALLHAREELELRVQERTRELRETNIQLEKISREDELTGLYNRRHLMEQLELAFKTAQRYRIPLCVMMLDIDHFKEINDKHGHLLGDETLAAVGHAIRRCLRATDIAGRYGGDEFCIVTLHSHLDEAMALAEKLRTASAVISDGDRPVPLKCSIGVVSYSAELGSVHALLEAADRALYRAKRAGRDRVHEGPLPPLDPMQA